MMLQAPRYQPYGGQLHSVWSSSYLFCTTAIMLTLLEIVTCFQEAQSYESKLIEDRAYDLAAPHYVNRGGSAWLNHKVNYEQHSNHIEESILCYQF